MEPLSSSFKDDSAGSFMGGSMRGSMRRPTKKKTPEEKVILVAFCLPKLCAFVDREDVTIPIESASTTAPEAQGLAVVTKTITVLLQTLEHAVDDAAEFYAGDVVSNMFSMVVCRFPTLADAVDGALLVEEILSTFTDKANKEKDLDMNLINFGACLPAAYITEARPIGFKHTSADAHRTRVCSEEFRILQAVVKFADEFEQFNLPGICCASTLLPHLRRWFATTSCSIVVGDTHQETVRVLRRITARDQVELVDESAVREAELRRLPRDVRKAWEKFDLNKDSELQRHEVHDVLFTLDYDLSEWEIDDFFDSIDADHSGTVSVKEFATAFTGPTLGCAALSRDIRLAAKRIAAQTGVDSLPLIMEMWNKYDTSGDGSLDTGELHCVLLDMGVEVVSSQEVQWLLNKFDEDDSGVVEFDEFSALVSSKGQRGGLNPTKQKINAAKRATQPKLLLETPAQVVANGKVQKQKVFDKYIIYFLFVWMMYNSGRATFRTFSRNVVPQDDINAIFDWCLDLFYLGWVIAKFCWLPWEDRGDYIVDPKEIVSRYLHSPDFWIDIIVLLPIDIAYWSDPTATTIGFYRLNKVFSLYYLPYTFEAVTHWISPTYGAVVRTIMWFIMAAHISACLFVEVSHSVGSEATEDIFEVPGLVDQDFASQELLYLRSLYWAILSLAGQIQGDGIPVLDIHVGLLLIVALSGLPLYAMLLATFSSVNEIQSAFNVYQTRLDRVMSYSDYFEFDTAFRQGSIDYFRHVFNTTGSLKLDYELPHDMPEELEILMNIEVGTRFLEKVPIFAPVLKSPTAGALINELVSRMKTRIVEPGTVVLQRGEDSTGMFFVQDGNFFGLGQGDRQLFHCGPGNFFGEIELLLGTKSITTVKATLGKYSNLLVVNKEDFEDVMTYFPDALNTLCDSAKERYQHLVDSENSVAQVQITDARKVLAREFRSGLLTQAEMEEKANLLDDRQTALSSRGGKRGGLSFGKTADDGMEMSDLSGPPGSGVGGASFSMLGASNDHLEEGSNASPGNSMSPKDAMMPPIPDAEELNNKKKRKGSNASGGTNNNSNDDSESFTTNSSNRNMQSISFGIKEDGTPRAADEAPAPLPGGSQKVGDGTVVTSYHASSAESSATIREVADPPPLPAQSTTALTGSTPPQQMPGTMRMVSADSDVSPPMSPGIASRVSPARAAVTTNPLSARSTTDMLLTTDPTSPSPPRDETTQVQSMGQSPTC